MKAPPVATGGAFPAARKSQRATSVGAGAPTTRGAARKRAGEIEADTGSGDDSDGSAASAVQQRTLTPPGSPTTIQHVTGEREQQASDEPAAASQGTSESMQVASAERAPQGAAEYVNADTEALTSEQGASGDASITERGREERKMLHKLQKRFDKQQDTLETMQAQLTLMAQFFMAQEQPMQGASTHKAASVKPSSRKSTPSTSTASRVSSKPRDDSSSSGDSEAGGSDADDGGDGVNVITHMNDYAVKRRAQLCSRPQAVIRSLEFAPPKDYRTDLAWSTRALAAAKTKVKAACKKARDEQRKYATTADNMPDTGASVMAGDWQADWLEVTLTCLGEAAEKARRYSTCTELLKFVGQISHYQDTGMDMLVNGASDEAVWQLLEGQIIELFMTKKPAEFTAQLLRYTVKKGTSFRDAVSDLGSRVHTSISVHPDTDSSKAHDKMRVDSIIGFLERQFAGIGLLQDLKKMQKRGKTSADMVRLLQQSNTLNLCAAPPVDAASYPVVYTPPKSSDAGGRDNDSDSSDEGSDSDSSSISNRRPKHKKKGKHRDRSSQHDGNGKADTTSKRRKAYDKQYLACIELMAVAIRENRPCYNCTATDHYWLECPEAYSTANFRAAKAQLKGTTLATRLPADEDTYKRLQTRFRARKSG